MKTFISAVLVTFMSISTAIASNHTWQTGTDREKKQAYAFVLSERFKQSTLVVYVQKAANCSMRLAIMTELGSNQKPDDIYVGAISARMKIDRNNIWTNENAKTYQGESNKQLFFDNLTVLDGELFGEMLQGNSMIVQVGKELTNEFSLTGFTVAIREAISVCESIEDEWSTNYSGDEWSS